MVLSILTRKTRVSERADYESRLQGALPGIRKVLEAQPGFVSVQYLWSPDEAGRIAQITSWNTVDDCLHYVRKGAAATVATLEEAALPTAPHPDGAWTRQNFEVVQGP